MLTLLLAMQAVQPPVTPPVPPVTGQGCRVEDAHAGAGPQPDFYALCEAGGVRLGEATLARTSYDPISGATAVVLERSDGARVLLISPVGEGRLHVDDVTRELTELSGRYVEAGLAGITVDLSRFAAEGVVTVPSTPRVYPPQGKAMIAAATATGSARGPITTAVLPLRPYVARVAAIAAAAIEAD